MTEWNLTLGCKEGLTYKNQSTQYTILKEQDKNHMIILTKYFFKKAFDNFQL